MNRRTTARFLLAISSLALAAPLSAFEWPVAEPRPARIFGQRAFGVAERGIVLEKADTVRASGYGELLIAIGENRNMSGFPGTLGNAVVLAHDDGLVTVYGNLDSLDRVAGRENAEAGTILGVAGSSAWGEGASAIFQVGDREQRTTLNPLLVLPPLTDKKAPAIRNAVAVAANGTVHQLGAAKSMRQGKYRVYADVLDSLDKIPYDFAPFRVTVQVNGKESASIPFELMSARDGKLCLSDPQFTWERLYSDPERLYLGELTLTRGRADITLIARDIAGNERSVLFALQIE